MDRVQSYIAGWLLGGFAALLLILFPVSWSVTGGTVECQMVLLTGVVMAFLTWLHIRGWNHARLYAVMIVTIFAMWTLPTDVQYLAVIVPAVFATVLTSNRWMVLSAVSVYGCLLVRAEFSGPYTNPGACSIYIVIIGGLFVGRYVLDTALSMLQQEHHTEAMQATARAFAHQVNQPLTAALGYLQLFETTPLQEREETDLALIHKELEHIAVLVREFNSAQTYATTPYANGAPMLELQSRITDERSLLYT